MNRQSIIELIVVRGAGMRSELQSKSIQELEKILDDSLIAGIRAEAAKDPQIVQRLRQAKEINEERLWSLFFFKHPEISDNAANRKMIFNFALSLSYDGVVTFENLAEAVKTLPGLDRQKVKQVPTAANAKHDEATLYEYCRMNRLEPNIATLNLLRREFGAGFNSDQVGSALQSGLINLGPASDEHILQWTRESQEERQDYLASQASPQELREIAKAEAEQRRIQAQQQHVAQQIQIREKAEASVGYPVLPETSADGTKLDAMFFKRLANTDIKKYKQFCSHYGFAAITARLNGVR